MDELGGFGIFLLIVFIGLMFIWIFYQMDRPKTFHRPTGQPRRPLWLQYHAFTRTELRYFTIYTSETVPSQNRWERYNEPRKESVTQKIQRILETYFNHSIDSIPDCTAIVSVPMQNFKSKIEPGYFEPPVEDGCGYFVCQTLGGGDRIQLTYFVEDGKRWLAGICFYIEDNYFRQLEYDEETILDVLRNPVL